MDEKVVTMPLYAYKGLTPKCGNRCFVASSCDLIGNVELKDDANLWFGVVARGDMEKIVVGIGTNIQDLTMLHVDSNLPLTIGDYVSVGHKAVLHACTVEDHCLIGIGSVILDGAIISNNSVVSAGSVVPPGKKYPPYSMIRGTPAKAVRELREDEIQLYGNHYKTYIRLKDEYLNKSMFFDLLPS